MAVPVIRLIIGALLLFFGHRLFWLFAALAGFLFGVQLAASLGTQWPQWVQILLGIGLGAIMALLAIVSVRVAGMLVGFLAGWVLVAEILATIGFQGGVVNLILVVLGGVIGALLALAVFDLAVVLLSALAGASTVIGALVPITGIAPGNLILLAIGVVLAIVGIVFQLREIDRTEVETV